MKKKSKVREFVKKLLQSINYRDPLDEDGALDIVYDNTYTMCRAQLQEFARGEVINGTH